MPRLIRRAPLKDRILALLDPEDFFDWLSEKLQDDTYEEWLKNWATTIGVGLNILFILARGASGAGSSSDDVFGEGDDGSSGSGWFSWLATFLVQILTIVCCVNTLYTFARRKHYRLFEQSVHVAPATPSAHRVLVNDSPAASSPLRYLRDVISSTAAAADLTSGTVPDEEREVWELRVWDPTPFSLSIFTLFSPGHLLLYYSLLPPSSADAKPSVTVLTALAFGALLSIQLRMLQSSFTQQAKDAALVHGEVMNEYDTKFVRPSLQRPVRDVGIQTRSTSTSPGPAVREVDVYHPTTILNRGFRTNPNPNYAAAYDPTGSSPRSATPNLTPTHNPATKRRQSLQPQLQSHLVSQGTGMQYTPQQSNPTPAMSTAATNTTTTGTPSADFSSPLKPHHIRQRPTPRPSGDGGSMGVYTHAASPLKRASGVGFGRVGALGADREREKKRMSMPGTGRY